MLQLRDFDVIRAINSPSVAVAETVLGLRTQSCVENWTAAGSSVVLLQELGVDLPVGIRFRSAFTFWRKTRS